MPSVFYRCLCSKQIKVSKERSTILAIKSLYVNVVFVVYKRTYIKKYEYREHGEKSNVGGISIDTERFKY